MSQKKNEVGNLPGYSSLGEIQKDLIDRLLQGFKTSRDLIDWQQDLIHSCFGNEEAVQEVDSLSREFLQSMYMASKEDHKQLFRERVATYLMLHVFPYPQRFFSGRAKENSAKEGGGVRHEEADLFGGGT